MQYQRNEEDFSRGKFRVRGDTIDVFPAEHSELAIRIELFDDEIETLQLFDPLTGRIRQKILRFTVYPSSHYVTPRDQVLAAVETIKLELAERLKELVGEGKLVEAQRLEQRTRFDLEMLSEVGHCKGIENYTRHLSGAAPGDPPATLTDYLPKDAIMFLDESHVLIGQFGAHVQRRPLAQDHAGGVRLSAAQRAGQPAAQVRGVRGPDAPGDLRVGDAGAVGEGPCRAGGRATGAARPAWSIRRSRCGRPHTRSTTCCRRSGSGSRSPSGC